jgi:hypothetical protein
LMLSRTKVKYIVFEILIAMKWRILLVAIWGHEDR